MPAKDRYHDTVVRALVKDGWQITHQQYTIVLPGRFLWIDLRAEKLAKNLSMLVEVKGFEHSSQIEYLASAIGKYMLYQSALALSDITEKLYLAIPLAAFSGIFNELIGRHLVSASSTRLIVFDPEREEIVQWID